MLESPDQNENIARAERLNAAAGLIAQDAPDGFAKDVTDIRRRIGLMVSALTTHDTTASCRSCGQPFTFNAARFAGLHFPPPRRCFPCREDRRAGIRRRPILETPNGIDA